MNKPSATPMRIDVLGSQISACDASGALRVLEDCVRQNSGGYVCFTNVHAVVTGRRSPDFQAITNNSLLSLADGKPVYWAARRNREAPVGHVPGPDFMLQALHHFSNRRHFFYGSTPQVTRTLVGSLRARIPGLQVAGTLSPPFRALTDSERLDLVRQVAEAGASFVWVGLGAPKQEQWMRDSWEQLRPAVTLGVGAAFDFHAGTLSRAPERWRRLGLEWLYRLSQEPGRLWKRYLVTNSLFVYYLLRRRFRP